MKVEIVGEVADCFGIQGVYTRLDGYQDINYLITTPDQNKFVVKISDGREADFIHSQNRLLEFLSDHGFKDRIPVPLRTPGGKAAIVSTEPRDHRIIRVFKYLEGIFLAESSPGIPFFHDLGAFFGKLDQALEGYHDPILQCRTHEWDLSGVMELREDVQLIRDPEIRRLVQYYLMKYREEVLPVQHSLPRQLIHADGNDWNILLTDSSPASSGKTDIAGLLDFGDMVYAPRINELAILMAYALMGAKEVEAVYDAVLDGYKTHINLNKPEIKALPWLIAARWCQTLVMAARQEQINPGSSYHQVSVEGAKRMLKKWVRRNRVEMVEEVEMVEVVEEVEMVELVELVEKRFRYFSGALSLSYPEPVHMTGAAFQYMYSADGRTYLDCVNNIPHVGHCHPRVVEAGQRQMARLNTNTRYLYRSLNEYAERLLSKFPPALNKVFFVNSGSAATDLAVRLVRAHTGRDQFLVLDHAYHGNTQTAISLSPYKFNRKGGAGKPENIRIIGLPAGNRAPPHEILR